MQRPSQLLFAFAPAVACTVLALGIVGTPSQAQECPSQGSIQFIGSGTSGTNGVPQLDTVGVPLEDKAFWFRLMKSRPGAKGLLFVSVNESAAFFAPFGAPFHPAPPFLAVQPFVLDADGESPPLFQYSTVPDLCGFELVAQAVVFDPAGPKNKALSRAARVRFAGPPRWPLFGGLSQPASSPESVATADLDLDGIPDAVTAAYSSSAVQVFLGEGDGFLTPAETVPVGSAPVSVAVGEFDGDGVPDLAVANAGSNDVSILIGSGDGSFAPAQPMPTGPGPYGIAVHDLNGDQVQDVIAACASGEVTVFLGSGGGAFAAPQSFVTGVSIQGPGLPRGDGSLAVGDLNGDGVADLAVGAETGVATLLGVGDGTFASSQVPFESYATRPLSVQLADLDGDGAQDLLVGHYNSSSIWIQLGIGDGTFAPAQKYPSWNQPLCHRVADLDGDGALDVVVVEWSRTSVLLGNGDGTLAAPVGFGPGGHSVAVQDMDHDGVLDLTVASHQKFEPGHLTVLLGVGDGNFASTRFLELGTDAPFFAVGDLDEDGLQDVVVTRAGKGHVQVLLGCEGGTFDPPQLLLTGAGRPSGLVIEDLDGDGSRDLVVIKDPPFSSGQGLVAVLMGHGDGTFAAPQGYVLSAGSSSPDFVAVGDLDVDGAPDLAVACSGSEKGVKVLLGQGDGTFGAYQTVHAAAVDCVLIEDLNGDGAGDIALCIDNSYSDRVQVLLGIGDGSFGPPVSLGVFSDSDPDRVVSADIDLDGVLDLAVDSRNGAAVFLGHGDGTFGPRITVNALGEARGVVVADFDGDALPDLAVISDRSNGSPTALDRVTVFIGVGDGTFPSSTYFYSGRDASWMAVADLDANGVDDLIMTDFLFGYDLTVLMNQLMW